MILEAYVHGSESSGLACSGDFNILYSPGDNGQLHLCDSDTSSMMTSSHTILNGSGSLYTGCKRIFKKSIRQKN